MSQSSPKPEVVYLPSIFRSIRDGTIRIPAFQRGFVWREKQILELLESVYNAYPIGSLLFWHVDSRTMRSATTADIPFPHTEPQGIVDFVLDGMQRVSSLYGAFNYPEHNQNVDRFSIVFDLAGQVFLPADQITESCIPLRKLFTPRSLLEEQARLGALKHGDVLVERSLELQRRFQEYLVPVVRIGTGESSEVVRIFERVNSTGTTLSAVDFMRALTWSADFDLTKVLERLASAVSETGFAVPTDTIAKCLALELGVPPISEHMVLLRHKEPQELNDAADATRAALLKAVVFMQESLGIFSYDYVPYEGQFLVIVSSAASEYPAEGLKRWYWTTGFSEGLQGRPDHYIARLAFAARKGIRLPDERLTLTREKLKSRPMRKGAALPMTFVASLGTSPLFSVLTGGAIDSYAVLRAYEASMIEPVFSWEDLDRANPSSARTDKVIANSVILSPEDRSKRLRPDEVRRAILHLAESEQGLQALRSQLIDENCIEAIASSDANAFFERRAAMIESRALELVS